MPKVIKIDEDTFNYLEKLVTRYGLHNFIVGGSFSMNALGIIDRKIGDLDIIVFQGHRGCSEIFKHFMLKQTRMEEDGEKVVELSEDWGYGEYGESKVNNTKHKKFEVTLPHEKKKGFFGSWGRSFMKPKKVEVCVFKYLGDELSVIPCEVQMEGTNRLLSILLGHPRDAVKAKKEYVKNIKTTYSGKENPTKSQVKHKKDIEAFEAFVEECKYDFARALVSEARQLDSFPKAELDEIKDLFLVFGLRMNRIQKLRANAFINKFKKKHPKIYKDLRRKYITDFGYDSCVFFADKGLILGHERRAVFEI